MLKIAGVEVRSAEHPGGLRTPVDQRPLLFRPIALRGVTARNRIMVGADVAVSRDRRHRRRLAARASRPVRDRRRRHRVRRGNRSRGARRRTHPLRRPLQGRATSRGYRRDHRLHQGHRRRAERSSWGMGVAGPRPARPGKDACRSGRRDAGLRLPPWTTVSSSAEAHAPGRAPPAALDREEIKEEVQAWHDAARRSSMPGFDIGDPRRARLPDQSVPVARWPITATTPMAATCRAACALRSSSPRLSAPRWPAGQAVVLPGLVGRRRRRPLGHRRHGHACEGTQGARRRCDRLLVAAD